jgi:hypothetical protein
MWTPPVRSLCKNNPQLLPRFIHFCEESDLLMFLPR